MYMTVLKEAQAKFMATPEFAVLAACLLVRCRHLPSSATAAAEALSTRCAE
jgi:hypothetical protein